MEPSWLTLLIQVPLVGVFIWYSLEMDKRGKESQKLYMEALDKRDAEYDRRNSALIGAINAMSAANTASSSAIQAEIKNLAECQTEHDRFVRENIQRKSHAEKDAPNR